MRRAYAGNGMAGRNLSGHWRRTGSGTPLAAEPVCLPPLAVRCSATRRALLLLLLLMLQRGGGGPDTTTPSPCAHVPHARLRGYTTRQQLDAEDVYM